MESDIGVREEANRIADQQKEVGAEKISDVAGAIHGAADQLEQEMPQLSTYIHEAAGRLQAVATDLRDRSADDLFEKAKAFGHDQPVALFSGAVLAGFAISRFLMSSNGTRIANTRQS